MITDYHCKPIHIGDKVRFVMTDYLGEVVALTDPRRSDSVVVKVGPDIKSYFELRHITKNIKNGNIHFWARLNHIVSMKRFEEGAHYTWVHSDSLIVLSSKLMETE